MELSFEKTFAHAQPFKHDLSLSLAFKKMIWETSLPKRHHHYGLSLSVPRHPSDQMT
jgi:hypothetical protein